MKSEVARILEACYAELLEGREPDLEKLCADAPELRPRVVRILAREREVLGAATCEDTGEHGTQRPAVTRRIDDFEVFEEIGSGGMGKVFRARQISLRREVALKLLREDVSDADGAKARMQREALVTAALEHENIVPIFATGESGDCIYIAMRLVRGQPLDKQALPLDPLRTARIGVAVARALHAAHEVGVLHRDVKPANVLLEGDTPYVVDFGLARLAAPTTQLTQGSAAPGTLAYMAPEILRERAPVFDPRVDVYGLGATLYETLCGHAPFRSDVQVRLLREVLYEDPKRLALPRRDRDLETIVLRALQKSPSDRFASAGAMADELERFLNGEPIQSRPIGELGRMWRRARRRPVASLSAAFATVLVVALAGFLIRSKLQQRQRRSLDLARIEAALTERDLTDARAELDRLRAGDAGPGVLELVARVDREADLRTLTLVLQSSFVQAHPSLVEPLVNRLRNWREPRARLACAAWTALIDEAGEVSLEPELALRFPRTDCVAGAIRRDADPAEALRKCSGDGGPTDRLFVAFLLRRHSLPSQVAEAELHGVDTGGPEGFAIQFARAIVFEEISRERAAFLELEPAYASDLARPFAACMMARLATTLGYPDAQDRLQRARALIGRDAPDYQRVFLAVTELQIARDIGDASSFWSVWERSASLLDRSRSYWMLGADVARAADDLARARRLAREGLTRVGDRSDGALSLRSIALQIDWLLTPFAEEPEPLESDALAKAADTIRTIERRATRLYDLARRKGRRIVASESLLMKARCARALGDRRRGWSLLDRACSDYEMPGALAHHGFLVAYRVLNRHVANARDDDISSGGPLGAACRVAYERARTVLRKARAGDPAAVAVADMAQLVRLACGFHCGYARDAVASALRLRDRRPPVAAPFEQLADRVIEWGGLPLYVFVEETVDPRFVASRVLETIEFLEGSRLTPDQRRTTYLRWGSTIRKEGRRDKAPWRDAMEAIRRRVERR